MKPPLVAVAFQAVLHARSKIPTTWNRPSDVERVVRETKGADPEGAKKAYLASGDKRRAEVKAAVSAKEKPNPGYSAFGFTLLAKPPEVLDADDKIMAVGKLAESHPVGNCAEMAAVAYHFLRQQGVAGVHYVDMLYDKRCVHNFVVIGASSSFQEKSGFILPTEDQVNRAFGRNAIICDPWLGKKGAVFLMNRWLEALAQMTAEITPRWNGSDAIKIAVAARSSALSREQKVALWTSQQQNAKQPPPALP